MDGWITVKLPYVWGRGGPSDTVIRSWWYKAGSPERLTVCRPPHVYFIKSLVIPVSDDFSYTALAVSRVPAADFEAGTLDPDRIIAHRCFPVGSRLPE